MEFLYKKEASHGICKASFVMETILDIIKHFDM